MGLNTTFVPTTVFYVVCYYYIVKYDVCIYWNIEPINAEHRSIDRILLEVMFKHDENNMKKLCVINY